MAQTVLHPGLAQRGFFEGGCWACGGGERKKKKKKKKKKSPGVQEHGRQPSRSPLALFLSFS
eukprot:1157487-Pelagomonas_calceolata.AAC.5